MCAGANGSLSLHNKVLSTVHTHAHAQNLEKRSFPVFCTNLLHKSTTTDTTLFTYCIGFYYCPRRQFSSISSFNLLADITDWKKSKSYEYLKGKKKHVVKQYIACYCSMLFFFKCFLRLSCLLFLLTNLTRRLFHAMNCCNP